MNREEEEEVEKMKHWPNAGKTLAQGNESEGDRVKHSRHARTRCDSRNVPCLCEHASGTARHCAGSSNQLAYKIQNWLHFFLSLLLARQ